MITITGCAGFVGSNLATRLVEDGYDVVGMDNLSHGDVDNLKGLIGNKHFTFNLADLRYPFNTEGSDMVVHLASEKIPRYSTSYGTITSNQKMIENVVDACVKSRSKLLFSSTSDVYGKNENVPFSEDSPLVMGNTNVKRWSYAVSKMHSEHLIIAAHEKYGLDYTVMRFFSAYGKNQASGWWGGVQSAFIDNILQHKEIEIHGSGMQSRCFTYIDDLIDGIMLCLKADNEIINLGNPSSQITVNGLAQTLFSMVGYEVPIKRLPYTSLGKYEDSKVKIPDITKAQSLLGFSPKIGLYEGLMRTINWKKSVLGL